MPSSPPPSLPLPPSLLLHPLSSLPVLLLLLSLFSPSLTLSPLSLFSRLPLSISSFPHLLSPYLPLSLSLSLSPSYPRVIAEGESLQDWKSKIVTIKRSFVQFPRLLKESRGEGEGRREGGREGGREGDSKFNSFTTAGFKISTAQQGNVLEALNLAVNGMYLSLVCRSASLISRLPSSGCKLQLCLTHSQRWKPGDEASSAHSL